MKLLLKESVKNLGKAGDLVTVKDGYGRNFLLPQGLAMTVTPGNLQTLETLKKRRANEEAERLTKLRELGARLANLNLTIAMLVSEGEQLYGAVSAREIAQAIAEEGITIDAECILPDEPIKMLGVFKVPVKLHPEVKIELKLWVVEKKESE